MKDDLVIKVGRDYVVNSDDVYGSVTNWTRKLKEATSFPSVKAARKTMQLLSLPFNWRSLTLSWRWGARLLYGPLPRASRQPSMRISGVLGSTWTVKIL